MDHGHTRSSQKSGKHAKSFNDLGSSVQFPDSSKENHAASVIQKVWKRWQDMAVFDYYKGLIGFKQCGKPSTLMKYIEPREAEYLDAAAGIHIRFRLGGLKFPPSIYYKIFTHRPIVDLCAYSPKDYAKLALQTREARKHQGKKDAEHVDWYKRIENNGWRLLSVRLWKIVDPITNDDNNKIKEFHYSKLTRRQEIEKRRKRRKIEWLKKMYFGKNLKVTTEDPFTTILIQRATEGLIGSLDKGIDKVMEWEVDEVLKWTNALNYETYIKEWGILEQAGFPRHFEVSSFLNDIMKFLRYLRYHGNSMKLCILVCPTNTIHHAESQKNNCSGVTHTLNFSSIKIKH